jgi:hypothetical protein
VKTCGFVSPNSALLIFAAIHWFAADPTQRASFIWFVDGNRSWQRCLSATVRITNRSAGFELEATTSDGGFHTFSNVQAGSYTVLSKHLDFVRYLAPM